ncbi:MULTISPECIES: class I SAM-dependent methyltransferase [Aeromicrobium]|uniref:EryCVI SAM-dependent methyltransferase n=1 Tax=Aeromicrobium erythreum TaxID=2041 RepID=Q5Y9G1_9ACTN|nr:MULTISPECIES: class I SAM-dependent methyltransferase [Aeromicrobium]AAU93810.1 N-methyltransferase [Aeromicrobium erythreum]ALX06081.1 EryCVI SAM-dependent methyltransferase [Aeromicrobium erythreum]
MYEGEFAELYDQFYEARGKDYAAEASAVTDLVRSRYPHADSVLDVACGTGSHLEPLSRSFGRVEGLELSPAMIEVAERRYPQLTVTQGDMRAIDLPRQFDAVTCMFSSIGHMVDVDELDAALDSFARHLAPQGVVVVEPWWFPETFLPGYVAADVVRVGDRAISRTSHSLRDGRVSRLEIHWLVADPTDGVRHETEHYEITLFEREEYETAFRQAGLDVEYLEGGPSGRGLFVGLHAG